LSPALVALVALDDRRFRSYHYPLIERFAVNTHSRVELVDITDQVREVIRKSGAGSGICVVYVPHTTAAVTVNENADPSVGMDINSVLSRLIPERGDYRHEEGNSDAHAKAALVGSSATVLVDNGGPVLGTWQGVFLCEFDGPRKRNVLVKTISD
jgi:secondary thiamine-phosphate synthase enzyme